MRKNSSTTPATDAETARRKLLAALTRRSLTEAEAAHKLKEWAVPIDVAREILNDYLRYGYLDDQRFAAAFVTARMARGYGWNRIRQELAVRKVPAVIIAEVEQKNAASESESSNDPLNETAAKEWRKLAREDTEVRRRRWIGRMQRRGFPLNRILIVLRALERQENTDVGTRFEEE